MPAPLTKPQKAYLAQLANRAYTQAGADTDGMDRADWRRSEVIRACGKHGLRCCSQDDYGAVKSHFLNALGRVGSALAADIRGAPAANHRRQAAWAITNQLQRMNLSRDYAASICRQMTRGAETLDTASEDNLWRVYYALRKQASRTAHRN
jgi:hypothetical protein